MRLASRTVDNRWVMIKVVRPRMSRRSVASSVTSVSASRALVGSSRIITGASLRKARAMARRWRWPPESITPRSPMAVA
jgi:hypothetical protein